LYTVTAARRSWAAANREAVVRYVRALGAAFRVIRDPAKRGAVVSAIVETTGVTPAIAERTPVTKAIRAGTPIMTTVQSR